ncbi:MAG: hypothetical protein Q9184_001483 [Pyrenodesmia sp. 2 TL-2023]
MIFRALDRSVTPQDCRVLVKHGQTSRSSPFVAALAKEYQLNDLADRSSIQRRNPSDAHERPQLQILTVDASMFQVQQEPSQQKDLSVMCPDPVDLPAYLTDWPNTSLAFQPQNGGTNACRNHGDRSTMVPREHYPLEVWFYRKVFYIVTNPDDVQALYKQTTTISWLRFVQDLYRWIGISQENIVRLWQAPTELQKAQDPVRRLPPNQMVEEYEHRQLLPGENMDKIAKTVVAYVDNMVRWDQVQSHCANVPLTVSTPADISLLDWTTEVFLRTTTEVYWGKSIWKVAPNLIRSFLVWEETTWKYIFQIPYLFSKDMYTARDQLIGAFTAYFGQPRSARADATYFVKAAEQELRDIAFDDNDVGKVHMLQFWAINGNVHKVTFWIFAYLAHDPNLLERIREETAAGVANDAPNVPFLTEQCPQLESLFLEVLRLKMSSSLMRHVTEPTVLGGKVLAKDHNVMVPYRQLHFDEDVWGENVSQFDPMRFLKDKHLSRSSSFRPFGGGQHLCPGRFLARHAVFSFVALALSRFEISLAPATDKSDGKARQCRQRFPRADESKPGLGCLAPVAGDRLILRIAPRGCE